jgi:hypothetical protein
LHLDFVLPSVGLRITSSGVFWPVAGQPGADWVGASDHRMVWLDLDVAAAPASADAEPDR